MLNYRALTIQFMLIDLFRLCIHAKICRIKVNSSDSIFYISLCELVNLHKKEVSLSFFKKIFFDWWEKKKSKAMIKKIKLKGWRKNRVLDTDLNYSGSWNLCSLAESTAHYFSTVPLSLLKIQLWKKVKWELTKLLRCSIWCCSCFFCSAIIFFFYHLGFMVQFFWKQW